MRARAKRLLVRVRDRALLPITDRLEELQQSTALRLDDLSRRVTDMEAVMQILDGRAATVTERSVATEESQVRLALRLQAIEGLLDGAAATRAGATGGDARPATGEAAPTGPEGRAG